MNPLVISSSPHLRSQTTLPSIMYDVILALLPALFFAVYAFGFSALRVILTAVISGMIFEAGFVWLWKKNKTAVQEAVFDGSGIVTSLLLAMNLPSSSPMWMVVIGNFVAIIIAKQSFGGVGFNLFNPALTARVFLLISFPVQMTHWPSPTFFTATDAISAATPLGILKTDGVAALDKIYSFTASFQGHSGGSLGEISALLLLLGAAYLFIKKIITWEIPFSMLVTLFAFSGIFYWLNSQQYASPWFHLVSGGTILGAFFMATDMVTSPITTKGKLIFGFSIGLLTAIIRLFGSYPEGVSFAILIVNAFVPLIDRYTKVKKFGLPSKSSSKKT